MSETGSTKGLSEFQKQQLAEIVRLESLPSASKVLIPNTQPNDGSVHLDSADWTQVELTVNSRTGASRHD
jgi:hypothetical protein